VRPGGHGSWAKLPGPLGTDCRAGGHAVDAEGMKELVVQLVGRNVGGAAWTQKYSVVSRLREKDKGVEGPREGGNLKLLRGGLRDMKKGNFHPHPGRLLALDQTHGRRGEL